jgi:HNH endonuclease
MHTKSRRGAETPAGMADTYRSTDMGIIPPIEQRLWDKVQKAGDDECWEWTGSRTQAGYGSISYKNRHHYAHRLIYELTHGPIPKNMLVCHTCDNPPCVNPSHLWIGTKGDNNRDMRDKGRDSTHNAARGERQGSAKLTEQSVRAIRDLHQKGHSLQSLAARFGVTSENIYIIVQRKSWKHI